MRPLRRSESAVRSNRYGPADLRPSVDLTTVRRHLMLWPRVPGAFMLVRNFIFWLSTKRSVTNSIARRGMKHGFARRFVAGETLAEALTASRELCQQGRNVSLNHLGENVTTEAAARDVCSSYIQMIEEMHARSEEHTSELQSHSDLVCRLLLEEKKN